jgi:polyferredoxin
LRVFRPRVLVYAAILGAVTVAGVASVVLRIPLKVDVIRDRVALSREGERGMIENVYRLQVMNTVESPRRFEIRASGLPSLVIAGDPVIEMPGAATRMVPVKLRVQPGQAAVGTHKIEFQVRALDAEGVEVRERSVFIVR